MSSCQRGLCLIYFIMTNIQIDQRMKNFSIAQIVQTDQWGILLFRGKPYQLRILTNIGKFSELEKQALIYAEFCRLKDKAMKVIKLKWIYLVYLK